MRSLDGRLGEEDAVVRDDADGHAVQPGKARDERRAVQGLELVKARAVDDARDDLPHVKGFLQVARNDSAELHGVV